MTHERSFLLKKASLCPPYARLPLRLKKIFAQVPENGRALCSQWRLSLQRINVSRAHARSRRLLQLAG
jgi:hypothetical protein